MSVQVALLRMSAVSIFTSLLFNSTAGAQHVDAPGAARAPAALDFTSYDCSVAGALQRDHVGQVIDGTYREWVAVSKSGERGREVRCVNELVPAARQLSRAEAQALLTASARPARSPVAQTERAASTTAPTAPTFEHGAAVGVATVGHALNDSHDTGDYAILDAGFGKTLAGNVASTQVAAAEADPATQIARERPAAIGVDERAAVASTNEAPFDSIGQLIVTWRDGTQSICTGTLISPYAVLTAGQCAHNRSKGGFAAKTTFAPGQRQASTSAVIEQLVASRFADYVETTGRWTQISGDESILVNDARADYAVYYFLTPWTHVTALMPITYDSATAAVGNHAGYPVSVGNQKGINQGMWFGSGAETNRSVNLLRSIQVREFAFDASTGSIGGPIWTFDGTNRSFVGIVSYGGDDFAGGVWFGGENKSLISAWAAWRPGSPSPAMARPSLNAPLTFPSSTTFASSYFRFYNPGLVAGTVSVTFHNGATGQVLGTWTSPPLPPRSSRQFDVIEMERAASPPIDATGKDNYTATIASDFQGFVQSVLWNEGGQSLTNISGCSNGLADNVSNLINVHTTNIPAYPSVIMVHNLANKASDAVIGVFDSMTGNRLGGIVVPAIAPSAAATFGAADIERVLQYTPAPDHYHYNLVIENDFYGYAQHIVNNNAAGLVTNMTAKCLMRP
jgi:V8-like Glu-specific endopeptidase